MNDRDALVSFYVEAVGKNWVNKELWNSEERVGLWFGIGMDVAGHVQAITLEGNNLTGCLMDLDMWKYLSNLKQLLLTNNALKKHLPFHLFHHLRSLEVLNLSWNEIEGEIPEELYSLSELQLIKLDSNRLRVHIHIQHTYTHTLILSYTHTLIKSEIPLLPTESSDQPKPTESNDKYGRGCILCGTQC